MTTEKLSRRTFIKSSGLSTVAASGASSLSVASASLRKRGSAETLRIGFVGPGGRGFNHIKNLSALREEGANIELAAVCEVYTEHMQRAARFIKEASGNSPIEYEDYREMYQKGDLDAVCIGTPDHWHAKQSIDALNAGIHVYCEKPMTKTVKQAIDVAKTWETTGTIMQVGVQSTSLPVWDWARDMLQSGRLGKVLMYQTEYFRNSSQGQWRYYKLDQNMTPTNINWQLWLGVEEGLTEEMPFDRAVYRQWRRFWPFGAGMYTDLFVHRTTTMLKATGLRFPARVVGSGGIYLEYDGRDVPDVATVVAEFNEGVQGLITATMCAQSTPIRQLIRGHYGSIVFGSGARFTGFDLIPEHSRVTGSELGPARIDVQPVVENATKAHFKNWLEAIRTGDQHKCNNPPDFGAAAIVVVNLGARSYREGKVFHFDPKTMKLSDGDRSWADRWERMSSERAKPKHIKGWRGGNKGSLLKDPDHQTLEGPG